MQVFRRRDRQREMSTRCREWRETSSEYYTDVEGKTWRKCTQYAADGHWWYVWVCVHDRKDPSRLPEDFATGGIWRNLVSDQYNWDMFLSTVGVSHNLTWEEWMQSYSIRAVREPEPPSSVGRD